MHLRAILGRLLLSIGATPSKAIDDEDSPTASEPLLNIETEKEDLWRHKDEPGSRLVATICYLLTTVAALLPVSLLFMVWLDYIRIYAVNSNEVVPSVVLSTRRIFSFDLLYGRRNPNETREAWSALQYDRATSDVYVKNYQKHGLFPSDLESGYIEYQRYTVAMYHQLHCLAIIREKFYGGNMSDTTLSSVSDFDQCFDYLRQSLLCSADMTLEYTRDGWEVEHKCRASEEIQNFMLEYGKAT